jgi:tRNA/tmRNA/rRNA uracil-C5-methylase (TrmA/RlmC/RlmD family)
MGRRSCELLPKDYLWTEIDGKKIFYSLDTFFQANLSILPELFRTIRQLPVWGGRPVFYDLYGGVGLFGVGLCGLAQKAVLIEENQASTKLARYNVAFNKITNFEVIEGRVEDHWPDLLKGNTDGAAVAMIDPPRAGLSPEACAFLAGMRQLRHMIYLSCSPESLARDLRQFVDKGWAVRRVVPFDFFPKTKHLETLVWLQS